MTAAEQKTHYRACNLCEAICGLEIITRGDNIVSIKGDKRDPLSQGFICPKATTLQDILHDPDRLRQPVVRSNNSWMHNYHRLVKGKSRNQLLLHPNDLAAIKLPDGAQAIR